MRFPVACLTFTLAWFALWGWQPRYRDVWITESVLVADMVPTMIHNDRRIGLSNLAYLLVTIFTAAGTTTERFVSSGLYLLLSHPDAFARLRDTFPALTLILAL